MAQKIKLNFYFFNKKLLRASYTEISVGVLNEWVSQCFKHVLKKFILVCNEMFIKQFLNNNTKAKMAINFKHQNYATCPTGGLTGGDIKIGKNDNLSFRDPCF